MGVSNRALVVLAALAVMAAGPSMLRRMPVPVRDLADTPAPARVAERALRDSVIRLRTRLALSRTRALVDSVLASSDRGGRSAVLELGGRIPPAVHGEAERLLAGLALAGSPAVEVQVVLVDSAVAPRPQTWQGAVFTILPDSSSRLRCTIVRVVGRGSPVAEWEAEPTRRASWGGTEGPCWYLANFGMPGAGMRAWLDSRYWDPARVLPDDHPGVLDREPGAGDARVLMRLAGDPRGMFVGGSVVLQACAMGRASVCEAALLQPYRMGLVPAGVVPRPFFGTSGLGFLGEPSALESSMLLAQMVETLGPDRFAGVWKSELSVQESFQSAAGRSFGQWYGDRVVQLAATAGAADPRPEPSLPAGAGYVLLALAVAVVQVRRRQVG